MGRDAPVPPTPRSINSVYDAVAEKGAFRHVASSSAPRFLVGADRLMIRYAPPRSTNIGWLIFDAKSVVVTESEPRLRARSIEALVWSLQGVINMHVPEKWDFVRFVSR